jgi:hypothetical protein
MQHKLLKIENSREMRVELIEVTMADQLPEALGFPWHFTVDDSFFRAGGQSR